MVLAVVLVLGVAACSGEDSSVTSGGPATQAADEAGLRAAVTKAGEGLLASDASATYELLSKECQAKVSKSEWAAQLLIGVGFLEAFAEVKLKDLKVGEVEVRNVTGSTGDARFAIVKQDGTEPLGSEGEQSWDTWIYEDGAWRTENCGGGSGGDGDTSDTTGPGEPTTTLAPGSLSGTDSSDFPAGTSGEVGVVASGKVAESIAVVVRNATDKVVYNIDVTATVRDDNGDLVVTGDSQGFLPSVVAPGEIAIGSVFLGYSVEIPDGAEATFTVTSDDEPSVFQDRPLLVTEVRQIDQRIVGVLSNTTGVELGSFVKVGLVCFDSSATPTAALTGSADQDRIPVDGSGTFTIEVGDAVCDTYLVGSAGSG